MTHTEWSMGVVTWCDFLGGWLHRGAESEYWNLRVPLTIPSCEFQVTWLANTFVYWQVTSRFTICTSTLLDTVHTCIYMCFLIRYLFPLILCFILTQNHLMWWSLLQTTWRPYTLPHCPFLFLIVPDHDHTINLISSNSDFLSRACMMPVSGYLMVLP